MNIDTPSFPAYNPPDMAVKIADIIGALEMPRGVQSVAGLHGGSKALLLGRLARARPSDTLFIIVPTQERAEELKEDCETLFHPDDARRLKIFPESSALPYSRLSPEPEDWADRIEVLNLLTHGEPVIVIASAAAAMRRVPPKDFISNAARAVRLKERVDPFELAQYLSNYGYEDVGLVEDEGSFARRGGILDIWPPTSELPVRLELDGDKIASMRLFDPATQRSKGDIRETLIIPVRDIPFDTASRESAAAKIRKRAEDADIPAREWRAIIESIREGIAFSGIETFMPLFQGTTATIFDYLPSTALVVVDEATDVESAAAAHFHEVTELARDTQSVERVIVPEEIVIPPESLSRAIKTFAVMRWNALTAEGETQTIANTEANTDIRPLLSGHKRGQDILTPLVARIALWQRQGWHVALTCHTELQAQRLIDLFRPHGADIKRLDAPFDSVAQTKSQSVWLKTGRLSAGFRWPDERLAVITDEEIFGGKITKRMSAGKPMEPFTSFAELADGDHLVHEQHGIGRYKGLAHLKIEGAEGDYLLLEYLGGDKLYLPVYRMNLVGRYIGSGDAAPFLDKLGGFRFAQAQQKVNTAIRILAKELLEIYAARELYPGAIFPDGGPQYEEFAAAFPYDETPDQARAIEEVMRDLKVERPTDRLICGDVGYGKTEVAMRAAYLAAMAGKQVAVLVPTTVLALQHFDSFTKRFKDTPVVIEMMSRFRSAKHLKDIVEKLKRGTVDIVIGTHRLVQKDVGFRDLGLLIIDEEHRFGVRHKERIKKLKSTVDVITLTATPIPRTLNLSLTGIRDISIINTPPANRHSIATYVVPFDEGVIRQATLREIARGGQVFFVHNRVETINSMHDRLKRLIPEARIVMGHGQMKEGELEKVMIDFIEKRADVLLCTTIIESGLDIPSANTIIIHRADTFGLAQLYQLRGRVGRASVRANAYLLTPEDGEISGLAKKRLTVLKRFTELGSGFQISMHDLEFRGAGNILGSAQSGHIATVGYELYARLLDREVRKLKGKRVDEEIDPELSLKVPAFLPENYVEDPGTRIDIYRRLASRESLEEIAAMADELTDRFGPLPGEAMNLLGVMEVKVLARKLRMKQITFDGATFACQVDASTPLSPQMLVELAEEGSINMRFSPPDRLLFPVDGNEGDLAILGSIKNSLSTLMAYVSEHH